MGFHLEYENSQGGLMRGGLVGDNLSQAEKNATQLFKKHAEDGYRVKYAEIYEDHITIHQTGSGELCSTWDGEEWTRIAN